MTRLFHTVSLGDAALTGFYILTARKGATGIQMLLVAQLPSLDPVMLTFLANPLAWAAGTISQIVIERRSKDWFRGRKTLAVTPSATI